MNSLFVEGGGHLGCLGHVPAVHQPEPGANLGEKHSHSSEQLEGGVNTYRGGEVDAVVDEVEGGASSDVLPLCPGGPACQQKHGVSPVNTTLGWVALSSQASQQDTNAPL